MKALTFFVCLFVCSTLANLPFQNQFFEGDSEWTSEMYAGASHVLLSSSPSVSERENDFDLNNQVDAAANGFMPEQKPIPQEIILFRPNISEVGNSSNDDGSSGSPKRAVGPSGPFSSTRSLGTGWPFQMVGKIFFQKQDNSNWVCSGAVVRRGLVLTAGHCVHPGDGSSATWHKNIQFVPQYKNGAAPYGIWYSQRSVTTNSWYYGGGGVPNAGDWGLLEISIKNQNLIGDYLGYFGWQTGRLVNNHLTMIGYPVSFDGGSIMHQVNSQFVRSRSPNCAEYPSDLTGGSSGGPWVEDFGIVASGQSVPYYNRIVGVVSYGPTDTTLKYQGSSILNNEFVNALNYACSFRATSC